MKRTGFTWLQVVLLLAFLGIVVAILLPVFVRSRCNERKASCQSNLKQIGLGFKQYLQDYDEKYPLVAGQNPPLKATRFHQRGVYGWADALQPYLKSTQIFQCPTEEICCKSNENPTKAGYTDYWLNSNFSGALTRIVARPSRTILLGDGNDGTDLTDARYNYFALPYAWLKDSQKPCYRHLAGANYGFVDDHVKWLKPEQITLARPNGRNYTFAIN